MAATDYLQTIRTIGAAIVVLALVTVVAGHVIGATVDLSHEHRAFQTDVRMGGSNATGLTGQNVTVHGVQQSLGEAAALDGSDGSYISGRSDYSVDSTWTVSTWAAVNNSTGTRTLVSLDSRIVLTYDGSGDEWACWRTAPDGSEVHRVAVAAPSESVLTNVKCTHDGSQLTITRNASASNAVVTDSANATGETLAAQNLNGTVDETRVFDAVVSGGAAQQLYDRPTAPLPGNARVARVMYERYGSGLGSVPVYIAGGALDAHNVHETAGLAGEPAVEGTDWTYSFGTLRLVDGGSLDGAPVVFADWESTVYGPFAYLLYRVQTIGASALGLLVLGLLVWAGTRAMDFVGGGGF